MATLGEAIVLAKSRYNSDGFADLAWYEVDALAYANDALDAIAMVMPELFHAVVNIACIPGTTMQTLNVADSLGLVDVLHVNGGNAVLPCDSKTLDRFIPGWNFMTAGAAENWMPVLSDPFRFKIYPPAPVGQVLVCIHVSKPLEYLAAETHILPNSFTPAIALYIMAISYQRDGLPDMYIKTMAEFQSQISIKE